MIANHAPVQVARRVMRDLGSVLIVAALRLADRNGARKELADRNAVVLRAHLVDSNQQAAGTASSRRGTNRNGVKAAHKRLAERDAVIHRALQRMVDQAIVATGSFPREADPVGLPIRTGVRVAVRRVPRVVHAPTVLLDANRKAQIPALPDPKDQATTIHNAGNRSNEPEIGHRH
jgi:hypothetical protein